MAVVISHALKVTPVRNLGWLLRNWSNVAEFHVCVGSPETSIHDCILVAQLHTGGQYITTFASCAVLWRFLHRPVFYGLTVDWFGETLTIAKASNDPRARVIAQSLGYWFP